MSNDLRTFLHEKGIATIRTTPYNPQCNGQTERYNGIIMKTVELALRQNQLNIQSWEKVLPDALHSIRSLISTATSVTPHERLFLHQRRSATGHSVPSWLSSPGPVLLKRHVRNSKYEPLVDQVHLIEANTQYAHVRFPNGRESTVSIRHLAPTTSDNIDNSSTNPQNVEVTTTSEQTNDQQETLSEVPNPNPVSPPRPQPEQAVIAQETNNQPDFQPVWRYTHLKTAPSRLIDEMMEKNS